MLRPLVFVVVLSLLVPPAAAGQSIFDWWREDDSSSEKSEERMLPSRPPSEPAGEALPSRPEPRRQDPWRQDVERARERVPRSPPAIGLLLPLSGEYQSFGEACFRGIRLALGAIGEGTPEIRTVVRDTRGEAATAVDGFRRLADEPGVVAVVGPMLSWEIDAVAPHAERAGLATVSLSQRTPDPQRAVFRFSMTKEAQAETLARHAVVEQGHQRFAILYPRNPFGIDVSTRFREAVERHGGEVMATVGYQRDKEDFQVEVAALRDELGMKPLDEGGSTRSRRERPAPVLPPVDAVFVPDTAERVALLAPQLAFFDIRNVQLLGASGWNQPDVLQTALPSVEGAVFVDGFFLYSFLPEVRDFVTAYRDAYGENPGVLEAFGHDVAAMVKTLIEEGGRTRDQFRSVMHRPARFRGATGWTRIRSGGDIEKEVFLLQMRDGTVEEIDRSGHPAYHAGWKSLSP